VNTENKLPFNDKKTPVKPVFFYGPDFEKSLFHRRGANFPSEKNCRVSVSSASSAAKTI
jgi:hypothetical protein